MKRFSVTIDPELLEEAMKLASVKKKREVIEIALREFVRSKALENLRDMAGKDLVIWNEEKLEQWRKGSLKRG